MTTTMVQGPERDEMSALLCSQPEHVPAVVEQLTGLQALLQGQSGVAALADFNRLHLRITTRVLDRLYAGRFADPAFLSQLYVEFAGRYFDALRLWGDTSEVCPRVWGVLLGRAAGPAPSAAAGVNAHLNFDLPFALVTTFEHHGSDPVDGGDQHRDYLQLHDLFAAAIPALRRGGVEKWQVLIDTMTGDLDDSWQGELADYTRNAAWRNAKRLWCVRHDQLVLAEQRERLDGHAAALGRLLTSPLGAWLD